MGIGEVACSFTASNEVDTNCTEALQTGHDFSLSNHSEIHTLR